MEGGQSLSPVDLEGLVSSAEKNADADEEDTIQAAVLSIRALKTAAVTTQILVDTQAGKRVRKLSKHSNEDVAAAAQEVVAMWKQVIKSEQEGGVAQPASLAGQKRSASEILGRTSGDLNGKHLRAERCSASAPLLALPSMGSRCPMLTQDIQLHQDPTT